MDAPASARRTLKEVRKFFNILGVRQFPRLRKRNSREDFTARVLSSLNGTEKLTETVQEAVNPSHFAQTEFDVKAAVELLNQKLIIDGFELIRVQQKFRLHKYDGFPEIGVPANALSNNYFQEMLGKGDARLLADDLDGVVTLSRTIIEAVLVDLEDRTRGTRQN